MRKPMTRQKWRAALALIAALALTAGCNGLPKPAPLGSGAGFMIFSGLPVPYFFTGTATQWNAEYAVTVRHMPFVAGTVYRCSSGCDLVFIENKTKGPVPRWRQFIPGERLTAEGSSPFLVRVKGEGIAKRTRIDLSDDASDALYAAHDGPTVKGMSGGPVYGSDGAVVGITVGFFGPFTKLDRLGSEELTSAKRVSVYLPYDEIQKEWDRFRALDPAIRGVPGSASLDATTLP